MRERPAAEPLGQSRDSPGGEGLARLLLFFQQLGQGAEPQLSTPAAILLLLQWLLFPFPVGKEVSGLPRAETSVG